MRKDNYFDILCKFGFEENLPGQKSKNQIIFHKIVKYLFYLDFLHLIPDFSRFKALTEFPL
jgi:hypothetical protein